MPPSSSYMAERRKNMKLLSTYTNLDRNSNPYIVVVYLDSKCNQRTIVLNHYDLEYCVKGKIKYEISKQNKK